MSSDHGDVNADKAHSEALAAEGQESGAPTMAAPPPQAEAGLSTAKAPTPTAAETRMQSALASLLKLLDSPADAAPPTPLHTVQRMCMRIPRLSDELTQAQRFRLYMLLLVDEEELAASGLMPPSWAKLAEKALETHVTVAQQAAALFPESLGVTVDELAGLFYHLGAETAFYFNPEMIDVILCMTTVVAGSTLSDKDMLLRSLFHLLSVLQKDFIVSTASRLYEPATTALLRLMLQFFDPALATHADQQQVDVGAFVLEWSRRLLVLHADFDTALKVLDWVFVLGDPVMVPYVALAYLITHRQRLMDLHTRQELTECLRSMKLELTSSPDAAVDPRLVDGRATALLPVWSGKSLLQNADLLYRVTPLSTQRMLDFCLYPDVGTLNKTPEALQHYYANTPCLPLERSDLASAFAKRVGGEEADELPAREYIIVDCRSQASFDYVRLPTAVLVGDILSYQQEELEAVMERLQPCRGHPLALFGTGRPIVEEVNLLKVLALFLINKKAFPFVCIVPGGFKTTIPLLRSRVIDAVLSPAAAASLEGPSKSAGPDWGQQASNTAHHLGAKLSEISGMLPHVETAEVRQKAEELSSKAKESVAAAGTWGWGVMQRLKEGLSETREQASTALSSVTTKLAAASSQGGPATEAAAGSEAAGSGTGSAVRRPPTATAAPSAAAPPQIFSLGEDGEEEDLDLITSIPTRPMRGTVVEAPAPTSAVPTATVAAAPAPAALVVETKPAAAAVEPATPPKVASPVVASPAPVPPPPPAAARATAPIAARVVAEVPRRASASQIAANIDAEFDELFGDLSTSPVRNTQSSASPTKPTATVDADDLFGE